MASRSVTTPFSRLASNQVRRIHPTTLRTTSHRSPWQRIPQVQGPALRAATQLRWHSTPSESSKQYGFDEIKALAESPSPNRILIDVREPSEYAAGYIPSALNIPISSQPDALLLPAHEFEERFEFPKPTAEQEVVFYCKAGIRSNAAVRLAMQAGWKSVGEYRGSWMDWEKNGGAVVK